MNEEAVSHAPEQEVTPHIKKRSVFVMLVACAGIALVAMIGIASIGYWYAGAQIEKPIPFTEKKVFVVAKGESVQKIAENLEQQKMISRGFYFWLYIWKSDLSRSLQAGTYAIEGSRSVKDIADMIARGDVMRDTISVTIPEGFTIADVDARFREAGLLKNETRRFADPTVGEFQEKYSFLTDAPVNASLEGYLFPDTYEFEKDVSLMAATERMLHNFEEKIAPARLLMQGQQKSVWEIVIMASIIEKEVITHEDMKTVSGVLWKRIAIGMPLQVDATVIYATGRKDITRADLAIDSPYNTYLYKGLPKGPIANPGTNAIIAAIQPTASDYLFYLSKPNKETVFSRTLQEHNAAVAKYLR